MYCGRGRPAVPAFGRSPVFSPAGMDPMSQDRLTTLEEKLAYQEHALQELHDALYAQQRQIEQLERRCERLNSRLAVLSEALRAEPGADEMPPHY